jgi:hypothetical protein
MSHCWMHPPENAAWSATTDDRRLEGAVAQELPLRALSRTQHFVIGLADTDGRLSEGSAPRLPKEAASSWDRHQRSLRRRRNENERSASNLEIYLTAGPSEKAPLRVHEPVAAASVGGCGNSVSHGGS